VEEIPAGDLQGELKWSLVNWLLEAPDSELSPRPKLMSRETGLVKIYWTQALHQPPLLSAPTVDVFPTEASKQPSHFNP
jgi:hypothetical protein